ncbi:MAG: hypothetical protein ACFCD0_10705 [Gemmataceae bacterium]
MKRFTILFALATLVGTGSVLFVVYRAQAVGEKGLSEKAIADLFGHVVKVQAALDAGKVKRAKAIADVRTHLKKVTKTKEKINDEVIVKLLQVTGLIKASLDQGTISQAVAIEKFSGLIKDFGDDTKYKTQMALKVSDPTKFKKLQKKAIFSGPQRGEKLPALQVTSTQGKFEGKEVDPVAVAGGKPQILIFLSGDESDKPLYWIGEALNRLTGKQTKGLQTCVVYVGDDRSKIRKLAKLADKPMPKGTLIGFSKEGRDGPGAYGLNRNVVMTIIVANKGKVVRNFAFAQPPFYPEPHVLGGVAEAIGVETRIFQSWLNEKTQKGRRYKANENNDKAERDQLVGERNTEDRRQARDKKQYKDRYAIPVKNPEGFKKLLKKGLFSGPQPGEKPPSFKVTGVRGNAAGREIDPVAEAKGRPQLLIFQTGEGAGLRGLIASTRLFSAINKQSKKDLQTTIVLLGDDATKLSDMAKRIQKYIPGEVLFGYSKEGRDGPGAYGLNRKVAQTILVAKGGKVVRNFPFAQGSVYADPYVLGAVAEVLGEKREMVAKWVNEANPRRDRANQDKPNVRKLVAQLRQMDKNNDGKITKKEAGKRGQRLFGFADANNDGVVDARELRSFPARLRSVMERKRRPETNNDRGRTEKKRGEKKDNK